MKRFFKSRSIKKQQPSHQVARNNATVEGIRKKLAGYQKIEGPAHFTQPAELNYLQNGTIEFSSPGKLADMTMGYAVPFTLN